MKKTELIKKLQKELKIIASLPCPTPEEAIRQKKALEHISIVLTDLKRGI